MSPGGTRPFLNKRFLGFLRNCQQTWKQQTLAFLSGIRQRTGD
jgi:hypothetical protein